MILSWNQRSHPGADLETHKRTHALSTVISYNLRVPIQSLNWTRAQHLQNNRRIAWSLEKIGRESRNPSRLRPFRSTKLKETKPNTWARASILSKRAIIVQVIDWFHIILHLHRVSKSIVLRNCLLMRMKLSRWVVILCQHHFYKTQMAWIVLIIAPTVLE